MMDQLDPLSKQEIPIQSYLDNDLCEIVIPVHPRLISLEEKVRLDTSIPISLIQSGDIKKEYEEDMGFYLSVLTDEQISMLGLKDYEKFRDDWKFSFRESKMGFLDLIWKFDGKQIEMGYVGVLVLVFNGIKEDNSLYGANDSRIHPNIFLAYLQNKMQPNCILFTREKFRGYKRPDTLIDEDGPRFLETTVYAFCSTYLDNVAQGLVLRNFGVKYLNELLSRLKD